MAKVNGIPHNILTTPSNPSPLHPCPAVKRKKHTATKKQLPASSTCKVEDNVKRLLKLSSFKLNDKLVQSAFKRSASRHYTLPDQEKAPAQTTSCFTEEDFKRFAAEYTV